MISSLTNKAYAVLDILLNAERSLTATEITSMNEVMNINTVQSVLRTLLKNGYIEVAQIVYSGNVLCRSYQVTAQAKRASVEQFVSDFKRLRKNVPLPQIVSALLDSAEPNSLFTEEFAAILADEKKAREGKH